LEFVCTSTGDNTQVEDRLANHICSLVELKTQNGSKHSCSVIPEYQDIRMDEDFSQRKSLATFPDKNFNNNTVTCYAPLYMFFSESVDKWLDTDFVEKLELVIRTAATKEAMGLPAELSDLQITLIADYVFSESKSGAKNVLGYDLFMESDDTVSGTSHSKPLAVDENVFATHTALRKNRVLQTINDFKIESSGYMISDTTFRMNLLNMLEDYDVKSGNQFLSYYWGVSNSRNQNMGCSNFRDMPPVTLTLGYDSITDYTRVTFHEYWVIIAINKYGKIKRI